MLLFVNLDCFFLFQLKFDMCISVWLWSQRTVDWRRWWKGQCANSNYSYNCREIPVNRTAVVWCFAQYTVSCSHHTYLQSTGVCYGAPQAIHHYVLYNNEARSFPRHQPRAIWHGTDRGKVVYELQSLMLIC